MILLRSWIYTIVFLAFTLIAAIVCLPALFSSRWSLAAIRMWARGVMALARTLVGISCRVEGREHLPAGACIVAAQHQSSFETYRLFIDLPDPVFVLKKELLLVPFVGWYIRRSGLVPIDRGGHAAAMRKMLRAADAALATGKQVVIFPEGTRTAPGARTPYRPGVAGLYAHCKAPLIPMALNSGYLWGKTRILKQPGEIVFRFLPALPEGLSREAMLDELRARIEAEAPSLAPPVAPTAEAR
ncbi:MAG: lysophospholipid acyltransferase family protein [Rhodospirillaceae bacterium]|nr:lysophospholipid acyltransferase family protein [Rhodospirillaceae bacterium]